MRKLLLALLVCSPAWSATVLRVACGATTGGADAAGNAWVADVSYTGGARYTAAALAALDRPYSFLRSSSPLGAPFSYSFALPPGAYKVTLSFLEPRADQVAGMRMLGVSINGAVVATGIDIFALVGALKPYSATFGVTLASTQLQVIISASVGNAVLSGIQVDSIDAPPAATERVGNCGTAIGYRYRYSTIPGGPLDAGGGYLTNGQYTALDCENTSGRALPVFAIRCRARFPDTAVLQVQAENATGQWVPIADPIACTPQGNTAAAFPGATYENGAVLTFVILVNYGTKIQPADWNIPDTVAVDEVIITVIRDPVAPSPKLLALESCTGTGIVHDKFGAIMLAPDTGLPWDCGEMLRARIRKADGTPLLMVGVPMPDTSTSVVSWRGLK